MPFPSCHQWPGHSLAPPSASRQGAAGSDEVVLSHLSRLDTSISSTFLHRTRPPALLAALLFSCRCFHIVLCFLYCETCTQYSMWSCSNAKHSVRITSLVGCAAFHTPHNVVCSLAARTHCWLMLSLLASALTRSLLLSCSAATHSQSVPVAGITAYQVQHLVFFFVELHNVAVCLMMTAIDGKDL